MRSRAEIATIPTSPRASMVAMATTRQRVGNWHPDGEVERARLRRDYIELDPAQRMKQVCDLSLFMSRVAEAGRAQRGA